MEIYLPCAGILGSVVWSGTEIPHSQGIPPYLYIEHMDMGPSISCLHMSPRLSASPRISVPPASTSPPFLPVWMNVASLMPWLLDSYAA